MENKYDKVKIYMRKYFYYDICVFFQLSFGHWNEENMRHVAIKYFRILFVQLLGLLVELAAVQVKPVNVAAVVRAFTRVEFILLERQEVECQGVNWNLELFYKLSF